MILDKVVSTSKPILVLNPASIPPGLMPLPTQRMTDPFVVQCPSAGGSL